MVAVVGDQRSMTKIFNRNTGKDRRQEIRNNLTKGEVILWLHLNRGQLGGFKFRRQHGIHDFVVDFYCPEFKLAVEVDGKSHDYEEIFNRDQRRQMIIENEGVVFKRYQSDAIFNHLTETLDDILRTCQALRDEQNLGNHPRP